MDPLRLLTRSTRISKGPRAHKTDAIPSKGRAQNPQLFGAGTTGSDSSKEASQSRKRKRGSRDIAEESTNARELDFFGGGNLRDENKDALEERRTGNRQAQDGEHRQQDGRSVQPGQDEPAPTEEERRRVLAQHKIKVTLLEEVQEEAPQKKKSKAVKTETKSAKAKRLLYPRPATAFRHLGPRYGLSRALAENIKSQGYSVPTEVQLAGLPLLLEDFQALVAEGSAHSKGTAKPDSPDADGPISIDLLTVAPTGSGKTISFFLPLIHALQCIRRRRIHQVADGGEQSPDVVGPQAVILAPTKELSSQIVNEGKKLAMNTGIKVTNMRKGMHLDPAKSEAQSESDKSTPPVKSDVLVSTPLTFLHAIEGLTAEDSSLSNIRYLILDEADVLLDPLFREQTLRIWNSLSRPDLRVSLWSATMGSSIEELARETIKKRQENLRKKVATSQDGATSGSLAAPLVRLIVGLKDSAVPNIDHQLIYAATEQGKLMGLRQLLHPTAAKDDPGPTLRAPFLVFTQTIERAVALHSELLYDIPPEAGGTSRIAVLHSGLSDTARDSVMTCLRRGEVWVLITTDLLSRGVDFQGINGVVNYDVPSSAAAYVHRVGRTGRAGRVGGVAVTFYTKEDIPYIKNVANIISASQKQRGGAEAGKGVQQWLLDSLPTPSKRDKQMLKKRGIEARRSGKAKDGKDSRKARISTKSGFERRLENNKRGAVAAQQVRKENGEGDEESGSEFGGFDD